MFWIFSSYCTYVPKLDIRNMCILIEIFNIVYLDKKCFKTFKLPRLFQHWSSSTLAGNCLLFLIACTWKINWKNNSCRIRFEEKTNHFHIHYGLANCWIANFSVLLQIIFNIPWNSMMHEWKIEVILTNLWKTRHVLKFIMYLSEKWTIFHP